MMHDRKVARGEPLSLRIGIHVGDVVESGNDILGDAVNVASRVVPLAEPGGICISGEVYSHVRNKSDLSFVSQGEKSLKNVMVPVSVYSVRMPWERQTPAEATVYPTNRIAILPFVSMSTDPNDGFFADGMTEEVISTVSGIGGLKVISRTSVMHYKMIEKTVEEIGRELKVGSVLEGSFRKVGNRIRVTTQLINVSDDEHLWAQNYDRNLDDVFEVQSDIAKQVAEALRVRILSPEKERIEKKPTESTEAYTLYLKGRYYWSKRGAENVKKASEYFELAVHEDPSFALGYVGLADCYLILKDWGFDMEANLEKARNMVARALELDPGLAEAHTTKGLMLRDEHNLRLAEKEFRDAIELKPSYATAHQWYFLLLLCQLRWDEALNQIEKAVELDPLSPVINYNHGIYYYARRDYGRAIELFRKVTALDPSYPPVHVLMISVYGRMKMYDDMRGEIAIVRGLLKGVYPSILDGWLKMAIARWEDDKETLRKLLPEAEAHVNEPGHIEVTIASYYFYLGEIDKGFEWLERAYTVKEDLSDIKYDPDCDGVRSDPRYLDLLKRLGLD
jgi:TolB-like protein